MTKIVSRKTLLIFMVTIMLFFVMVTSVYAASRTVQIYNGDGPVRSAAIAATNGAKYNGYNYKSSGHRLYIDLQWSNGSGWVNQATKLMDKGQPANGSSTRSGTLLWRVQLNPQYAFSDCRGYGTVSNR